MACPRGHDVSTTGRTGDGECRQCSRDRRRAKRRAEYPALRRETLLAYGDGPCAECGHRPDDALDLELHHVNGDGAAHRTAARGTDRAGRRFYRWLKASGWPHDPPMRTLCRPCHRAETTEERRAA